MASRPGLTASYFPLEDGGKPLSAEAVSQGYLPPRRFINSSQRQTWVRGLWQAFMFFAFISPSVGLFLVIYLISTFLSMDLFFSPMRPLLFPLAITALLSGTLSFTEAKAIDLAWNLVAGRGIQAIMAVMLYGVATSALLRLSENSPVSYKFFATVSLYPSSLSSIPTLIKGIFKNRGWRVRAATIWIFVSCAIIIAIPNPLDAMTGYVAMQNIMLEMPDGVWVEFRSDKYELHSVLEAKQNRTSTWILPIDYDQPGSPHVKCTPEDAYRWGFAPNIAIVNCSLLIAWGIGTWALWIDAQHNTQQHRKSRKMTVFSVMYDITEAMKFELGDHIGAYSGQEIEKHLRKRRPIMYTKETTKDGYRHIRLSAKEGPKFKLSFHETYR